LRRRTPALYRCWIRARDPTGRTSGPRSPALQMLGSQRSQYHLRSWPISVQATVFEGASDMTETLASKTCTPCRGGIPPLTREQAALFHGQAPDWQLLEEAHRIERSFRFRNFREALPLFRRLVNSRKLNAIIRISASVGAMQRSRCIPRRSRDYMRTTSSLPLRSTAYSLGRPRRERVLLVLQFAALFRCKACDGVPRGVPP
jgi:hypothetical protein